jgi:hypothetical protein
VAILKTVRGLYLKVVGGTAKIILSRKLRNIGNDVLIEMHVHFSGQHTGPSADNEARSKIAGMEG